jgi:hypothetical protein
MLVLASAPSVGGEAAALQSQPVIGDDMLRGPVCLSDSGRNCAFGASRGLGSPARAGVGKAMVQIQWEIAKLGAASIMK